LKKLVRKTKQREVIYNELCKLTSHPTADELFMIVKDKLPRVSLGTIYRNLEIMSEEGIVKKIEICGKMKRFDGNTSDHLHVKCIKCGKIEDIFLDNFDYINNFITNFVKDKTAFKIMGCDIQMSGLCSDCRNDALSFN